MDKNCPKCNPKSKYNTLCRQHGAAAGLQKLLDDNEALRAENKRLRAVVEKCEKALEHARDEMKRAWCDTSIAPVFTADELRPIEEALAAARAKEGKHGS